MSRPGAKFKLLSWGVINKPTVSPPGSLRVVFILCILSTIGTLLYAVFTTVSMESGFYDAPPGLVVFSFLHFLMPVVIAYTITTNNPSSRILILAYLITASLLFLNGWDFPRLATSVSPHHAIIVFVTVVLTVHWLYRSRKMRYYYAMIRDQGVPPDLVQYGDALAGDSWLSERMRTRIYWLTDNLETVVLIGFIVVVLIAFGMTG